MKGERRKTLEAVDLNRLAAKVREITTSHIENRGKSRGVRYEFIIEPATIPPAAGNYAELREALVRLTQNALDAMPGGGRITVRTGSLGDRVFLSVEDTGKGIPDTMKDRVFEPFVSINPSRAGLCLPAVRSFVKRSQGDIKCQSGEGRGTTFTIYLNIHGKMMQGTWGEDNVKGQRNRSLDILIVDDEKDVLDVLKEMIELIGHRVTATVSPREAVEIIGRKKFDIIITDISMPELTGWELLAKIKEMGVSSPVLLISGRADSIPGGRIAAEGGAGILPKPFRLDDLRSAIRGLIEKGGTG